MKWISVEHLNMSRKSLSEHNKAVRPQLSVISENVAYEENNVKFNPSQPVNLRRMTSSTPSMQWVWFIQFDLQRLDEFFEHFFSRVIREQYWSCSWIRCRNWSKREKILFIILIVLSLIIVALVVIISILADVQHSERSHTWISWRT